MDIASTKMNMKVVALALLFACNGVEGQPGAEHSGFGGIRYGPKGCIELARSATGSCVMLPHCDGLDTSGIEFAFNCVRGKEVTRHSLGKGGKLIDGFENIKEYDTNEKCDRCEAPFPYRAHSANELPDLEEKPVAKHQVEQHESKVPNAVAFRLRGKKQSTGKMLPSMYGPKGCVSTYPNEKGNCVVHTDCSGTDTSKFEFGFICEEKNGVQVRHVFGKGSFGDEEAFDTLVPCQKCLGLTDVPAQVTLGREIDAMSKDIAEMTGAVEQISQNVLKLNKVVFPSASAPAVVSVPAPAPAVALLGQAERISKSYIQEEGTHGALDGSANDEKQLVASKDLERGHLVSNVKQDAGDESESDDEDDGDEYDSEDDTEDLKKAQRRNAWSQSKADDDHASNAGRDTEVPVVKAQKAIARHDAPDSADDDDDVDDDAYLVDEPVAASVKPEKQETHPRKQAEEDDGDGAYAVEKQVSPPPVKKLMGDDVDDDYEGGDDDARDDAYDADEPASSLRRGEVRAKTEDVTGVEPVPASLKAEHQVSKAQKHSEDDADDAYAVEEAVEDDGDGAYKVDERPEVDVHEQLEEAASKLHQLRQDVNEKGGGSKDADAEAAHPEKGEGRAQKQAEEDDDDGAYAVDEPVAVQAKPVKKALEVHGVDEAKALIAKQHKEEVRALNKHADPEDDGAYDVNE